MTLTLDPRTTALVLIDLQYGILGRPLAPHAGPAVVERSAALGHKLAASGGIIALVNVGFSADGADRLAVEVDEAMAGGTPPANWAEFVPEIAALPATVHVKKRQWGAFHGTELDLQLRRRGIATIVLGGVATNFGVESTAREAWQHNYAVVVAEDACTTMSEEMHRFSMQKIMPRIARVRSAAEIMAAF